MKTSTPHAALCKSLGAALKQTRNAHPLSLQQLSASSGVTMSCISVIERGQSNPTIDTINRLATAMDTTPADLLRFAEQLNT
jgi:transcriptional regulator with XRE-family HTH domain